VPGFWSRRFWTWTLGEASEVVGVITSGERLGVGLFKPILRGYAAAVCQHVMGSDGRQRALLSYQESAIRTLI
jgi:hypothetical protein